MPVLWSFHLYHPSRKLCIDIIIKKGLWIAFIHSMDNRIKDKTILSSVNESTWVPPLTYIYIHIYIITNRKLKVKTTLGHPWCPKNSWGCRPNSNYLLASVAGTTMPVLWSFHLYHPSCKLCIDIIIKKGLWIAFIHSMDNRIKDKTILSSVNESTWVPPLTYMYIHIYIITNRKLKVKTLGHPWCPKNSWGCRPNSNYLLTSVVLSKSPITHVRNTYVNC